MNIKIPTKEELKTINDYITEQEFFKRDTSGTVIEMFIALISYGMDAETAINNISALVGAIQNEYGD